MAKKSKSKSKPLPFKPLKPKPEEMVAKVSAVEPTSNSTLDALDNVLEEEIQILQIQFQLRGLERIREVLKIK